MRHLIYIAVLVAGTAKADFYLQGDISAMQSLSKRQPTPYTIEFSQQDIRTYYQTNFRSFDINYTCNPYASISGGYDWQWRKFTLDLFAEHKSAPLCNDRGQNSIGVSLRWYLFR